MIKNNQFTLPTKFGNVAVLINGVNSFHVSARLRKESGYGNEEPFIITIRGKTYNHFSYHAGFNPATNSIDHSTYDFDGNTVIFASKYPDNSYFKIQGMYFDATEAAKQALAAEILSKLNEFYSQNKEEINKIWAEIAENKRLAKIEGLREEIIKLKEEIQEKEKEIEKLSEYTLTMG